MQPILYVWVVPVYFNGGGWMPLLKGTGTGDKNGPKGIWIDRRQASSNWPNLFLILSRLLNSFFPIGWWINWNSLSLFWKFKWVLYCFLKKKIHSQMAIENLQEHKRVLFKIGKRFAGIFWKLKWNSKAICVPCIRVRRIINIKRASYKIKSYIKEHFKFCLSCHTTLRQL